MKLAVVLATSNPEKDENMLIENHMIFDNEQNAIEVFSNLIANSEFDWSLCGIETKTYPASYKSSLCTIKWSRMGQQILSDQKTRFNLHLAT